MMLSSRSISCLPQRIPALLFLLTLSLPLLLHAFTPPPDLSAQSIMLINCDTGKALYTQSAHKQLYPASLTKLATLLFILDMFQDQISAQKVIAKREALSMMSQQRKQAHDYQDPPYLLEPDGTTCHLLEGEHLPLTDLLYGMILASGNDAANVLADTLGDGSISHFMRQLNAYLCSIGCQESHLLNPHGLHHPNHYTTAYDLARITTFLMQHPLARKICGTKTATRPATNKQPLATFTHGTRLLHPGRWFYPFVTAAKTGYTQASGYSIMAVAQHRDRHLAVILMGCPTKAALYQNTIQLFQAAFLEEPQARTLFDHTESLFDHIISGGRGPLHACLAQDLIITYYPSEAPMLTCRFCWEPPSLPIEKGARVGYLEVSDQESGLMLKTLSLYAHDQIAASLLHRTKILLKGMPLHLISPVFILICLGATLWKITRS